MATKKVKRPAVIDFETKPITSWPDYPPQPVGVSITLPSEKRGKYYAWGHPTENNCAKIDAVRALKAVWDSGVEVLCHNAKFDLDVAQAHMSCPMLPWERIHDTMFLIFLDDPHAPNLKLKPTAERLLNLPPDEQDALRDWLISQRIIPRTTKEVGEHIHRCPGKLVGTYANGDTARTRDIFELLYPRVLAAGMGPAYDRERRLLPVLLRNEHQGVLVNLVKMGEDDKKYEAASVSVDDWLKKQLKVGKDFNLDSDMQLADALIASKKADPALFNITPTGKRSVAKDSLIGAVTDKRILQGLQYRSRLATAHGTFLRPWYHEALACKQATGTALVHPSWNQVRQHGHSGGDAGARTGRLSVSRFLNVPKEFKERETGPNAYKHPSHIKGLPELPFMREYMLPFKGDVWVKRDYMQQELRVLGHFGDGELMNRFSDDPSLDVHDLAAKLIHERFGVKVTRDDTKTLGFGLLYGMGLGSLAERLGTDVKQAGTIKKAYLGIFPELDDLQEGLKAYARADSPLTTWGGRKYYVEPPKYMEKRGRVVSFEYKLLNYLIQGSSADCTKEAVIRYDEAKKDGRFLLCVHDEINLSVPKKAVKTEAQILREVMASVEFDVPMLSDCSIGPNWGALEKFKEPALILPPWR